MKAVAITSGKGGVGKTNVTVNLGLALADAGRRCLLLDADMGLANLDVVLGWASHRTLLDVIEQRVSLESAIARVEPRLHLLPSPSGVLKLERLGEDQRARLVEDIERLRDDYDVLLVDTGSGLTENVLFFCDWADGVVLVTEPEPTALTDGYALVKVLSQSYDVTNIALLVNQVESSTQAAQIRDRFGSVCARHLNLSLPYLGNVLSDPTLPQAVAERRPVFRADSNSPASDCFRRIAARFDEALTCDPAQLRDRRYWTARRREQLQRKISLDPML
ncbi:MAG: MinD/ParA family protein [Myxococcales bacterium]|nr:MinD/ParA family protein [Myxococcales bacterium]